MKMRSRIALVTGAALGYKNGGPSIGSAIAFRLASEGAAVVVVDVLEEMGQRTVNKIRENGGAGLFGCRFCPTNSDQCDLPWIRENSEFGG